MRPTFTGRPEALWLKLKRRNGCSLAAMEIGRTHRRVPRHVSRTAPAMGKTTLGDEAEKTRMARTPYSVRYVACLIGPKLRSGCRQDAGTQTLDKTCLPGIKGNLRYGLLPGWQKRQDGPVEWSYQDRF